MPPGYRVELVASEPLVQEPVAMDWDTSGRLWVVEMPGFMADLTGSNEQDPIGRVVVLEDTNADGRMDKRTVFADRLVLARSIKVLDHGVLIAEPPNVWLMSDDDGDLKADRRTLVTDRYGRRDADPQNNANGFQWALDNRMYTAGQADIHLRLTGGRFETTRTLQRGEWGVTEDDAGRIYRNTNESAVHVDLVPTHYYARNPSLVRTRGSYERLATGNEDLNIVWPVRPNPGTNRAYQTGIDRPGRNPVQVHLRVCADGLSRRSPAGGALRQCVRGRTGSEPRVAAGARGRQRGPDRTEGLPARRVPRVHRRTLQACLPVQCAGRHALHRGSLPRHHRAPHLDHRVPPRSDSRTPSRSRHRIRAHLSRDARDDDARRQRAAAKCLDRRAREGLSHPNGWWRDTAQRLLVERHDSAAVPALVALASTADKWQTRLHALWTLDGLDAIEPALVTAALGDKQPEVRNSAIRLAERWLGQPGHPIAAEIAKRVDDNHPWIRAQLGGVAGRAAGRATRGSAREAAAARRRRAGHRRCRA